MAQKYHTAIGYAYYSTVGADAIVANTTIFQHVRIHVKVAPNTSRSHKASSTESSTLDRVGPIARTVGAPAILAFAAKGSLGIGRLRGRRRIE